MVGAMNQFFCFTTACFAVAGACVVNVNGSFAQAQGIYTTKLTSPVIGNAPKGTRFVEIKLRHTPENLPTDGIYSLGFQPDPPLQEWQSKPENYGTINQLLVFLTDKTGRPLLTANVTSDLAPTMNIEYRDGKIVSFDLLVDGGGNLIDRWLNYMNIKDEYGRMLVMDGDEAKTVAIGNPGKPTFAARSERVHSY